jgi:HlyD family secretion protein
MRGQTIIFLIPDGTTVKKGDVLCRFDSSAFEEMARLQEIDVRRAIAERRQAELDLDSNRVGLRAYRDGEVAQQTDAFRGQIALMRADLQRATEKLAWTERMLKIRYVSATAVANDRYTLLSMKEGLRQAEGGFEVFTRYTAPKVLRELESRIEAADERLAFATLQLKNQEKRLAKIRRQIDSCTIRAPHEGLVVHADVVYGPELHLREGMQVHQGQPMFFLPDLAHLVAAISLHESISARVKVGMQARLRIPAFPNRVFTGRVTRIDQLPKWNWRAGMDIWHFEARVAINEAPKGVLPDMSAEVQIITGKRKDALVVPTEALTFEDDRPYCYVAASGGLERREVRLSPAGRDLLEVLEGLSDGDEVVLHPSQLGDRALDSVADESARWTADNRQLGEAAWLAFGVP